MVKPKMLVCAKCGYLIEHCRCRNPKTNADRIRSMSDEELAEFLFGTDHYHDDGERILKIGGGIVNDYIDDIFEWLRKETHE